MQHLALCLWLFQVAASSLLFYGRENGHCSGAASVSLDYSRFCIENDTLIVKDCHAGFEVHHYGPGALHSQADGVREGSLVVANPQASVYRVDQRTGISALVEYWRCLFHVGEVTFGDMARKIGELDADVRVYLIAKPGTDVATYRFERAPLEYPSLSGLGHLVSDYGLIDVALEDSSLVWADFVLHAHPDLVEAWTRTLDRALKLLGIVISSVIAKRVSGDQEMEALNRLSGCSSAAGRLLSARENGASVQETVYSIVRSAHPLLEVVRVVKMASKHAPYLRALGIEAFYYVEKTFPGRVEMTHDIVGLQGRVAKRCNEINWADARLPSPDVLKGIVDRLRKSSEYRDDACTMLVSLKYSALAADMKEALLKESMEVCQKHQLQEAIPMLFMLSFGRWEWERSAGFYQQLKSCQSIEAMLQEIASLVARSRKHECQRQNYWGLYCGGMLSLAPHFTDIVTGALSYARAFERPYCQCRVCMEWDMSKDVLFHCIGEGLSRPMGLPCGFRHVLSHLSYKELNAEWISLRTCIDSMRPSWHSQYTLDDAVAEFVYKNGPLLMRRLLAGCANRMKLGDRTMPELPNRAVLVEVVGGVPEGSRLNGVYYSRFSESGIGAAEVAARWMSANPDYSVLSRRIVDEAVCVLEDGLVAMSNHAFQDSNMADSLMRYAGPRTVGQLSRTINSRNSHVSVQADRQSSRIRVCRVVGNEWNRGWWTQSVVLRWSPERGVSLFQFGRDQEQTACFSTDMTVPELFCIFKCPSFSDPDAVLARYRGEAGATEGAGTVRLDSDVVPIVHENGDLDLLASPSGVEVRLTDANKTNPVVRVLNEHCLSEYCLNGIPYVLREVQTWEHMECMVRELFRNPIVAFRVSGDQ